MMRVGFLLNLTAAALITLAVYFLVPPLWNLSLDVIPPAFQL